MKPVEQRQLWTPDGQRGDCFRACVASICEVDYEGVPEALTGGSSQALRDWLKATMPGITAQYRYLRPLGDAETLDSWREWPSSHYEEGFWIATVYSHRIPDEETFGCGCASRVPGGEPDCKWCHGEPDKRPMGIQWGLHAVVMENAKLAYDPHPDRDKGFGPFAGATTFRVVNPALALSALRKAA